MKNLGQGKGHIVGIAVMRNNRSRW
jgi:hypothetical protein